MTGSPIVFMYPDANGVVNLSHRITQSYTMPAPDPNPPRTADLLSSSVVCGLLVFEDLFGDFFFFNLFASCFL